MHDDLKPTQVNTCSNVNSVFEDCNIPLHNRICM